MVLNLVVWPQSDGKTILAEFKLGRGALGLFITERYHLSLEVFEQNHKFANLQEIKLVACQC